MTPERKKAEALIYEVFDTLDPSKTNTNYYKDLFASMSDAKFVSFISKEFPFRLHVRPFEIEPTMNEIEEACDVLGIPLMEKVNLPHIYTNADGKSVTSQICLVGYIPIKKMKQFITKKNSMSTGISERDMKTGLLVSFDKNGQTSDREMESLAVMGLSETTKEVSRQRADSMDAKGVFYSTINNEGRVSLKDAPVSPDDSLSKNLMNVYLLGSVINSNIINEDYYLPYTLKAKERKVQRES